MAFDTAVAMKLTTDIVIVGEHLRTDMEGYDWARCCECGADKGIVGYYAHNPMSIVPAIRDIAHRVLHEEWGVNDHRITGVFGYLHGRYPMEPCDDGCPHKDKW